MRYFFIVLLMSLIIPAAAMAAGPHEGLSCTGCHGIHTATGEIIFAVDANTKAINPNTNQPYKGVSALCLGCHSEEGGMGIMPVTGEASHPFGITPNPKIAQVPAELLRGGSFECVSCHDPHPSNTNHKYLRVSTSKGNDMETFCNLCHSAKSGKSVAGDKVFSSMDERKPPTAAPKASQ